MLKKYLRQRENVSQGFYIKQNLLSSVKGTDLCLINTQECKAYYSCDSYLRNLEYKLKITKITGEMLVNMSTGVKHYMYLYE